MEYHGMELCCVKFQMLTLVLYVVMYTLLPVLATCSFFPQHVALHVERNWVCSISFDGLKETGMQCIYASWTVCCVSETCRMFMNICSSRETAFRQFVSLWLMNGSTHHSRWDMPAESYDTLSGHCCWYSPSVVLRSHQKLVGNLFEHVHPIWPSIYSTLLPASENTDTLIIIIQLVMCQRW